MDGLLIYTEPARGNRAPAPPAAPRGGRYFDRTAFATLRAACDRLLNRLGGILPIEVAGPIDARRAAPDFQDDAAAAAAGDCGEAYRALLNALEAVAAARFGGPFAGLAAHDQDDLLIETERGQLTGPASAHDLARTLGALAAEACEIYYSHPAAEPEPRGCGPTSAHALESDGLFPPQLFR